MSEFDPSEHFITLKGGIKYLKVQHRVLWLRTERGDRYGIETELLQHDLEAGFALFKATVRDDSGRAIAQAHGSETKLDFKDYIEKAEAKAVGRAAAWAGYGTTNAEESDEMDSKSGEPRIVDSGVEPKVRVVNKEEPAQTTIACAECGNKIAGFQISGGPFVSADEIAKKSLALTGKCLCRKCYAEYQKQGKIA